MKKEELIDQVMTMTKEEISDLIRVVKERQRQLQSARKLLFNVGDLVTIDHRAHTSMEIYIVKKINSKTIQVQGHSGFPNAERNMYNCSPGILKMA